MNRRKSASVLSVLLVLIFVTLFAHAAFAAGTPETAARTRSITYLTHPVLFAAMGGEAAISAFTARTGIQVEVITMPIPQIREKIMAEFIAGTSTFDVINMNDAIFNTDVTPNLEPLDRYLASSPPVEYSDVIPGVVDMFRVGDSLYAMPNRVGTGVVYYRTDLFEEYGIAIPRTHAELLEAARRLTLDLDGDGVTDIYGMGIKAGDTQTLGSDFIRYFFSFGGDLMNDDLTEIRFNRDAGVQTLDLYRTLVREGLVDQEYTTWLADDLVVAQQQGRVAMALHFSPSYGRLNNPDVSTIAGNVSAFPVPTAPGVPIGRTWSSAWGLALNRNSRNKDAGWELIREFLSPETQLRSGLEFNNGPVRASVYQNPRFINFLSEDVAGAWLKGLENGVGLPPHPQWAEMEDALSRAVFQVVGGSASARDALNRAAQEVERILR